MLDSEIKRLLEAYPAIFLACHRRHVREDETGKIVTEHQASVLDHLRVDRSTTLSHLAEHMGIGRSAMSIMVRKLIRGGYVRRRRNQDDGRSVSLTLTAAGARVKEQNTVLDPELTRNMLRPMLAAERELALRGIESLARYARFQMRRGKRQRKERR